MTPEQICQLINDGNELCEKIALLLDVKKEQEAVVAAEASFAAGRILDTLQRIGGLR